MGLFTEEKPDDGQTDFMNSHFPIFAAGVAGVFTLYRAFAGKVHGEPLTPVCMSCGVFPPAFFTLVGTLACHEMLMDMTGHAGGLTAWAPAVLTLVVATWVAYRGQVAASGGELGLSYVVPVVALASLFLSWMIAEEDPGPPKELTRAELKRAAREAALHTMKHLSSAPTVKMMALENGDDVVAAQLHVAIGVAVVVVLVLALVNGPGVWPRNLQEGSFPTCFMIAVGIMACNSFLREVRSYEGGCLDDFVPAIGAFFGSTLIAHGATALQKPKVQTEES